MKITKTRQTIRNLNIISRCLYYIREVQFSDFGLTRAQHSFCSRIYENPGINQDELSNLLKMDKTTTSKAIKKLTNLGFIKRTRSETNHRSWELYVTDQFSNMRNDLDETIQGTVDNLLENVTAEELKIFDDVLEKIKTNVFEEWSEIKKSE